MSNAKRREELDAAILSVKESPGLAVSRCEMLLERLRNAFEAHGPASLFFANWLLETKGKPFTLYCHQHVGKFPKSFSSMWDKHMARGSSPILRRIRKRIAGAAEVGRTHALLRSDVATDAEWRISRIYTNLAQGLSISDQLLGWHQTSDYVFAFILRAVGDARFDRRDCDDLAYAINRMVASPGFLADVLDPDHRQPRLTQKLLVVRDLMMLGLTNEEIAVQTRKSLATVEGDTKTVRAAYRARSKVDVLLQFILRGGTRDDLIAMREAYRL